MADHLEKLGSIGAVVAAAACPICFPKLAVVGTLFGLGAFSAYEAQLFIAAQALVLVAAAGHLLAYRQHCNARLLTSALLSAVFVFVGLYWVPTEWLVYVGFGGLVAASTVDLWARIRRWARRPKLFTAHLPELRRSPLRNHAARRMPVL
jgi:mercuric ion transport protein